MWPAHLELALGQLMKYFYQNCQLINSRQQMTRSFGAVSPTIGKLLRAYAASRVALRRLGGWSGKILAALRDSEPQSTEDYERELRERVFLPPQP
jgi:hypothetical protein